MGQKIFKERINQGFSEIQKEKKINTLLVVCGISCRKLNIATEVSAISIDQIWFDEFSPNPTYESVEKGVKVFQKERCDGILAIGGGSAMDVAKCIKLYSTMNSLNYLEQEPVVNEVPLIAIPTTAGTGSEATKFAVIYYQGNKQSVVHDSIIPEYVFLMPGVLKELPIYQKKATMMDAMCHAIESFWSVNSTKESKAYSEQAIRKILSNMEGYLKGDEIASNEMLIAAHIAGKAINITQTTAGHAMCYKITSLYGLAHGHAAALCISKLWPYMLGHIEGCIDPRGKEYLQKIFDELAAVFSCETSKAAANYFIRLMEILELDAPHIETEEQLTILAASVNITRLINNPVKLSKDTLLELYRQILHG